MRDEKTGKLFMRTASGNWVELPDDMQLYTDPVTGKIFLGQPPPRLIPFNPNNSNFIHKSLCIQSACTLVRLVKMILSILDLLPRFQALGSFEAY